MFELPQRRRGFMRALTLGALATAVLPGKTFGQPPDEHEIDLKKVPAHVREAASKAAPHVHWKTAFKSDQNGEVMYEIEGLDGKKREVTVILDAKGKVEEIETVIPVEEVPEIVMKALRAKVPTLEIDSVTEIQEHKKVVAFDFAGTRSASHKPTGVYVSADGKTVEIEQE
jgi:hypothetical protein